VKFLGYNRLGVQFTSVVGARSPSAGSMAAICDPMHAFSFIRTVEMLSGAVACDVAVVTLSYVS